MRDISSPRRVRRDVAHATSRHHAVAAQSVGKMVGVGGIGQAGRHVATNTEVPVQCLPWVIVGSVTSVVCPIYPQHRTSGLGPTWHLGENRLKHAVQVRKSCRGWDARRLYGRQTAPDGAVAGAPGGASLRVSKSRYRLFATSSRTACASACLTMMMRRRERPRECATAGGSVILDPFASAAGRLIARFNWSTPNP